MNPRYDFEETDYIIQYISQKEPKSSEKLNFYIETIQTVFELLKEIQKTPKKIQRFNKMLNAHYH